MRFPNPRQLDWYLVGTVLLLLVVSVVMIYSLTLVRGQASLAWGQAAYGGIGLALAAGVTAINYRRFHLLAPAVYAAVVALLAAVPAVGTTIFGAKRWIDLGVFQLQPSELAKLALVLILARLLADRYGEVRARDLGVIILALAIPVLLVAEQPDLGTAGVLCLTALLMLAVAKLPRSLWLGLIALGALVVPILFASLEDYQLERIQTFLAPTSDPYGAGYNVIQSLIAVGNGGLVGQGIGYGTQSQLDFLPVVHTDFIFAGIAESTGLVGSLILITILAVLVSRALLIAHRAPDTFGALVAAGIASLWLVQVAVNIGMNLGLAPVTGIPLPFISHGGTALITNLLAVGILETIAIRARTPRSHTR
ncbi:rod shape-determining protein RodA [Candidatus Berkelbacteria bacterium]|nr:rod shape-determining protein RodA [Candidatus Berkelbacteria bacterium]